MIHCPKCGAANPRGSRFCSECGEPLPLRTALRCPMCGTMNPVGNVYCDMCQARLIPMAAPRSEEPEREQPPVEEPSPPIPLPEGEGERQEAEDWLGQLRASAMEEAEVPDTAEEPIEPVEIPDWLREMGPVGADTGAQPPEEPPFIEPRFEEAVPKAPSPVEEESPGPLQEPAPADLPDWLRAAMPPTAEAPPEEAAPIAPAPAPAEVPDWLREIAPPEEKEAAPPAEAAPPVPAFEGLVPPPPTAPGIEIGEPEELAPAAIPDWLQDLRPQPEAVTEVAEEEPVETEGLLEGLRGVLPSIPAFQVPSVREEAGASDAREASIARAQLLQSLLARPAKAPQPKAAKQGISTGERIQRWLVAAVLLAVTVAILIAPTIPVSVPTLTQPVISPGVSRAYETIRDIGTGDSVLIAFEYGPSEADELNLVAEPILRHLLDQGAQISVVSTRPQGLAVAEGLLSTIRPSGQRYPQSYKPGDATGVSNLLADAGTPSLILVMTAQPGPLRWWVEQARALPDEPPPVVGGVSAALESTTSPYLDANARQITGAVHGLSGAAAYEALLGSPGHAHQRLNTLAVGHAAIVGLMILGAVFYTLGGLHRRVK